MVPNDEIPIVAANQSAADQWVRDNVLSYYPNTMIRYILVGNEVLSNKDDERLWRNGTCDELVPGSSCYQPVSIVSHANYAFSSYWAKFRENGETCHFNGLAVQTTIDPSHGSCKFPYVSL
ncbi:hypothetical protein HAX54_023014 [Datura stramonium]|uniref:X8 domain-containing protein n=1 Tax=Datura stramonium TaxID=4076 RepID=A0ABS8UWN9_DATST|nr:hypothetical protein [Datura stramonium]